MNINASTSLISNHAMAMHLDRTMNVGLLSSQGDKVVDTEKQL